MALFMGCKAPKITYLPFESKEVISERLVPYEVPADSAMIRLLLECDSTGNVLMKELQETKTKNMLTELKLNDKEIIYQIQRVKEEGQVIVRDTFRIEKIPYPVETVTYINKPTTWQNIESWGFRIAVAGLVIFLLIKKFFK